MKPVGRTTTVRWLKALVALPGTVLIVIPGVILLATGGMVWAPTAPLSIGLVWLGAVIGVAGACLGTWATWLFMRFGEGTAAPWDPARRLIARGPYRFVRNPMIIAVFMMLVGESLWFRSWALMAWLAAFVAGYLLYIPLIEEKRLAIRFGADYEAYRRNVPRWIPRPTPREELPDEPD